MSIVLRSWACHWEMDREALAREILKRQAKGLTTKPVAVGNFGIEKNNKRKREKSR